MEWWYTVEIKLVGSPEVLWRMFDAFTLRVDLKACLGAV